MLSGSALKNRVGFIKHGICHKISNSSIKFPIGFRIRIGSIGQNGTKVFLYVLAVGLYKSIYVVIGSKTIGNSDLFAFNFNQVQLFFFAVGKKNQKSKEKKKLPFHIKLLIINLPVF